MRFYKIQIFNADNSLAQGFTSLGADNITPDPGALNINFDVEQYNQGGTSGAGYIKIWGISRLLVSQSTLFYNLRLSFSFGMSKGLPLANSAEQGVPIEGQINNVFGNWQGVNQTLDLFFIPKLGTLTNPVNLVLNWLAGTSLATAAKNAIQTAFPTTQVVVNINPRLITNSDQQGIYKTLDQLSTALNNLSRQIIKDAGYLGVQIRFANNAIFVQDGTNNVNTTTGNAATGATADNPKIIDFNDLVGQPTWQSLVQVQVQLVLRGDLYVGQYIKLPPTLQTTSQASWNPLRNQLSFTGVYFIFRIRHVGNFRQPSGQSWITIIDTNAETTPVQS